MLIRKAGINERIERFSKLTTAVEGDADLAAGGSPLQLTQQEIKDTKAALEGPIYNTHSARACALVLVRLDSLLSGGGASYNHPVITVEHVLPQQPLANSLWCTWFNDPAEQERWLHRIGNLALLTRSKNSAARNFEFDKKKEACFKKGGISPFVLTMQVIDKPTWTPAVVEKRHDQLINLMCKHWRLENGSPDLR